MSSPSSPQDGALCDILGRRRLILATAVLLSLAGLFAWQTMPREEDPRFPDRQGLVVTPFPGADAEAVERLVVEPIEEALSEVEQIRKIESTARTGVAVIFVEMKEFIYDTDTAWDDVEDALQEARREFPSGVGEPILNDDLVSQEAIVLAVTGSPDPLVLADAADLLKRELIALPEVKQVKITADPGEQITIEYDDAVARRLGVDPRYLGAQLAQRSLLIPGGTIQLGTKTANLRPQTEFRSLEEIAATPIMLATGASVPLGELARIRRGPEEPASERMRWNGVPAIGLGIVPPDGIDRVAFGEVIRERLDELRPKVAPLQVDEVVFQPESVAKRLDELSLSLQLGILIVTGVLFLFMGMRLGLMVAVILPLVSATAMAIYAAGGGILHQISISALVIALGMLVDNAIVVVEAIQYRLDRGEPMMAATTAAVRELAFPLGTATGTTLAAFVPMLLSPGGTADFTRTIPVLIMLTLVVSYIFAILVTPSLAGIFLRPRVASENRANAWTERISNLGVQRPFTVLATALALMIVTGMGAGFVDKEFFPGADRTMVVVDLEMPEGTHINSTDDVTRRLEIALQDNDDVVSVAAFVGRSGPHFYYNLRSIPESPQRAQLFVEVTELAAVDRVIVWAREHARQELPEVSVVPRRLAQGPPVDAPIEVRLFGNDLEDLATAAEVVLGEVRAVEGSRDVRHDLGLGTPTVDFEIDDAAAGRHGLTRTDVALALLGRTLGSEVGQFRIGEDPVPILIRSSAGQNFPAADLATIDVAAPGTAPVPLAQLAQLDVAWRPAAIRHYQRARTASVYAEVAADTTASAVMGVLQERLDGAELPAGVRIEYGGELEESGNANAALFRMMPIGALLLLFFLLAEFNSFRRVAIILGTVPLAAVGVVPGLLLADQPFGFMSTLGMISLIGIVVNNAIVLIDVVETRRGEGQSIDNALREAVRRRLRPILLTMTTTVAGLSPLAFSGTLWPPLAWAMMSGLIASTALTLVVVPALYKLLFREGGSAAAPLPPKAAVAAAAVAFLAVVTVRPAKANEPLSLTLDEAMARISETPTARAAARNSDAALYGSIAQNRLSYMPTVGLVVDATRRDRDFLLNTPLGNFTLGDRDSVAGAVQVSQPIYSPAQRLTGSAASQEAVAALSVTIRTVQELKAEAAQRFVRVLGIDASLASTDAFIASLRARLTETEERVDAGRTLEADALKVRLDLEAAELDRLSLLEARRVAVLDLARAVGHDGGVEPVAAEAWDREGPEQTPYLVAEALKGRDDLRALDARIASLEFREKAVRAEALPAVKAVATWQRSTGDPFRADELLDATVNVSWNPFAAGTRGVRRAALEAQRDSLAADYTEARRGVALQVENAVAQLTTARESVKVRERGVELATETLRVEQERHRAGRSTTNDLLDAEAALRNQRTLHELARLDVLLAWVAMDLATGRGEPWPEIR